MECLKFYSFFNNLVGLPMVIENNLPYKLKFLLEVYQRVTEILLLLITVAQFLALPGVWSDMNVFCGCLSSATHSMQILLKTAFFNFRKNDFTQYLKQIASVERFSENFEKEFLRSNPSFTYFYEKQFKYARIILIIHFAITFLSTSAYFLPFVYYFIVFSNDIEHQLTPIVVDLLFDINWTPMFQIMIMVLTTSFYLINLKTVVVDNFIVGLITLNTSHYRYHKKLLRRGLINCSQRIADKNRLLKSNFERNGEKNLVREWIFAHQKLMGTTVYFEKIISPYLLLEFIYILIHTCVPAFVITSTFSWTVTQKMAVFFIVGGGLVELMLMSRAGDFFTEMWETVDSDFFQPDLYRRERNWFFHVFIMIRIRLKRPFQLGAFRLFPLGSPTFATILRLIVSHYMALNQIKKLKN